MSALQLWLQNHNRKLTQAAIDEALMEYITHVEKQREELLAALKAAADELREQKRSIGFRAHTLAVIEQAEAAIARAKGSTS